MIQAPVVLGLDWPCSGEQKEHAVSKKIANTKRSGLSVARVDRNRLDALYYQLLDLVKESGLAYEHFFAKPRDVPSEKSIDWYTELNGTARQLSTLSGEDYAKATETLRTYLGNLKNYAEQLRQSGEQSGANLITNALNIPDESYVYVLDDQVVVTCWGFSNAENSLVKDGDIVGRIKEKQETGTAQPSRTSQTTSGDGGAAASEAEAKHGDGVQPSEQAAESTPSDRAAQEPTAPKRSWLLPLLLGCALVLAGAFAAWYFLFKDKNSEDMAFLQGSYKAHDMLINEQGETVDLLLVFPGKDGKGESSITSPRQQCRGKVQAHQGQDGKVVLEVDTQACPDGNNFEAFTLVCDKVSYACEAKNKNGAVWNLEITKN